MSEASPETGAAPPPARQPLPIAPPPSVLAAAGSTASTEMITCPECGTTALVTLNRRQSDDFCRQCDYPLFWVPSRILLGRAGDGGDESLRRLPGTVGRATIASATCPHCAEPNSVTADVCVRCGLTMHPVAPPPPPPLPAIQPAPQPPVEEPEPEPDPAWAWWVWLLICLSAAAAIAVVTYLILSSTT